MSSFPLRHMCLTTLPSSARREYNIFQKMLNLFPDMKEGVKTGSITEAELLSIGTSVSAECLYAVVRMLT